MARQAEAVLLSIEASNHEHLTHDLPADPKLADQESDARGDRSPDVDDPVPTPTMIAGVIGPLPLLEATLDVDELALRQVQASGL